MVYYTLTSVCRHYTVENCSTNLTIITAELQTNPTQNIYLMLKEIILPIEHTVRVSEVSLCCAVFYVSGVNVMYCDTLSSYVIYRKSKPHHHLT